MIRKTLVLLLMLPPLLSAQENNQANVWDGFRYFIGTWEGTGKGQLGVSQLQREYQFSMNGRYIQVKHRSVYRPQGKNPKGEVHEDLGIFSFDRNRKQYVLRQFHIEGFVNQYLLESRSSDGARFVFTSESIENIPAGWRARETYKIINDNEFIEVFEIAAPGREFEVYTENHFRRKK